MTGCVGLFGIFAYMETLGHIISISCFVLAGFLLGFMAGVHISDLASKRKSVEKMSSDSVELMVVKTAKVREFVGNGKHWWQCRECDTTTFHKMLGGNFCPGCGAKIIV